MKALSVIADGFSRWIDSVAGTVMTLHGWLAPPPVIKLVEGECGEFAIEADQQIVGSISSEQRIEIEKGQVTSAISSEVRAAIENSRVELVLQPSRFLFRKLELPSRAGEFLEGVVRAQLDGLTPWSAAEAAFGWSKPAEVAGGRITLTIAATARSLILPHLQPIANLGARSIVVTTSADKTDTNRIRVWEQRAGRGVMQAARIRSWLVTLLAVSGSTAALAVSASMIAGPILDARQEALTRHVREIGATSSDSRGVASGSAAAAWQLLERRKNDRPPNVIVLETLSQILPDHTYVTGLRVEDDKLKISGITQDAPPLIGLLEQSGQFAQATFFAPTTHSPAESGERFNIEAHIRPLGGPRS